MNYELKGLSDLSYSLIGQSRKIKLRQVSFTNVISRWNMISTVPNNVEVPVQSTPIEENNLASVAEPVASVEDNVVATPTVETNKVPVKVSSLADVIVLVDENWGVLQTLKRRVLAVSEEMYTNINNNVNNSINGVSVEEAPVEPQTEAPVVEDTIDSINEEEIKQAVKDAFDGIDFNTPVVDNIETNKVEENNQAVKDAFDQIDFSQPAEEDIVISPEEVNNAVVDANDISFSFGDNNEEETSKDDELSIDFGVSSDEDTNDVASPEVDNSDADTGLFSFEDINFDKIDSDAKDDVVSYSIDDTESSAINAGELDDLLSEVKALQAKKDEQDRKTADAEKLATEKEQEKEKAKAEFIQYKSEIKEELDKSRKIEEENLERARKAEEFTAAISKVMNSSSDATISL